MPRVNQRIRSASPEAALPEEDREKDRFFAQKSELPSRDSDVSNAVRQAEALVGLDHPELHSPGFANHVLVPGWVPHQLYVGFLDAVDAQDFALGVVRDRWAHSATGSRQGHFHFDFRAATFFLDKTTVVDKAKVDDVDRDFRVVALS